MADYVALPSDRSLRLVPNDPDNAITLLEAALAAQKKKRFAASEGWANLWRSVISVALCFIYHANPLQKL